MNGSNTRTELAKALAKAQAEMKNPAFDSTNPHFKSKFASLVSVREAVLPVLNKHGLTLSQFPKTSEGRAGCVNVLMHVSGEWIEEECLLPLDKNNAQGAGSAITYARRYSVQAIGGVVADQDDDGNAASAPTNGPKAAIPANHGAGDDLDQPQKLMVEHTRDKVVEALEAGKDWDAYALCESLTDEMIAEKLYLWSLLDSKQRSRLKKQGEAAKKSDPKLKAV